MTPSACDCCDQPPLPEVILEWQSQAATCADTCGARNLDITNVELDQGGVVVNVPIDPCLYYRHYQRWVTYDACDPPITGAEAYGEQCTYDPDIDCCSGPVLFGPQPSCCEYIGAGFIILAGCRTNTHTFADLITTCDLTFGDWADGGGAHHYISRAGNERAKSFARFRVRHQPAALCYLKVWFRAFRQNYALIGDSCNAWELDGTPEPIEAPEPYEWNGDGAPCLPTPARSVDHEDNLIRGDWVAIDPPEDIEPAEGAAILIEHKFSCHPDYEPEWGEANGWPFLNAP